VSIARPRLTAGERRVALVRTATRVFSQASYRGTTTAGIARACGVSEPILYRHFTSKRDLYLACLEAAWTDLRESWTDVIAEHPNPAEWIGHSREQEVLVWRLWGQALTEAADDSEIRTYLSGHLRDVHGFVAGVVRAAQEGGHVPAEHDPDAEAWIFIGIGLIVGQDVVGLSDDELGRIRDSRMRWLTGRR
jgi:AcrR family transcriptional regulator